MKHFVRKARSVKTQPGKMNKSTYAHFIIESFAEGRGITLENILLEMRSRVFNYFFYALQADPDEEKRITRFFQHLIKARALDFLVKEKKSTFFFSFLNH